MKINLNPNYNFLTQNNNKKVQIAPKENPASEPVNPISFKRINGNLVKPTFRTSLQEKIANKITSYLKLMPENSRLKAPTIMQFEDNIIEIFIDKMNSTGIANVAVKVKNKKNKESGLNLVVKRNGQIESGICHEDDKLNLMFERTRDGVSKMTYGNASYTLISEKGNIWQRKGGSGNHSLSPYAHIKMVFNNTQLREFLSEMAKKHTSFLAK